jgi:hypothetical protein
MENRPYNQKLHDMLIAQGYTYTSRVHYDRYILDKRIIMYYSHNYIIIIEPDGTVAPQKAYEELRSVL